MAAVDLTVHPPRAADGAQATADAPVTGRDVAITAEDVRHVAGRIRLLSWISFAWMSLEGAVAITAGILASSIALIGFGLDSAVEGVASLIIVWRFTGHRIFSSASEDRAQKLVAIQFFILAPYVAYESVSALATGHRPDESWIGIGLAASSVIGMPILGIAKQRLADRLGSAATKGEGRQNMLCAYLATALLAGLLGNALFGAWWLDPSIGLLIVAVAVKEGLEAWRGEGCCAMPPLDGMDPGSEDRACCSSGAGDDCCSASESDDCCTSGSGDGCCS